MTSPRRCFGRAVAVVSAVCAALLAGASPAAARAPSIDWQPCEDAQGFDCATFPVPRDYRHPHGRTLDLAAVRLPATDPSRRVGSLFVNFGGPGGPAVSTIKAFGAEAFASLNDRFDIVGFDPRGVGESEDAIDCRANQETLGVYRQPFPTPENLDVRAWVNVNKRYIRRCLRLNPRILPYVSTANVARDMDRLRRAVGDRKLSYLGFSYGTFLGATYASLFPNHYRALVLDGALDANKYINRPLLREAGLAVPGGGAGGRRGRRLRADPARGGPLLHPQPGRHLRSADRPLLRDRGAGAALPARPGHLHRGG